MNPLDLFLREHAFVHASSVAKAQLYNMPDYMLDGLDDDTLRRGPHGMNSLAWIFWHLARTEDGLVSTIVAQSPQLLDDAWSARLACATTSIHPDPRQLADRINLAALWEYRNAVGARTRSLAQSLWPARWDEPIVAADIQRAGTAGVIAADAVAAMQTYLPGKSRESALLWWGLHHSIWHLGQASTLLSVLDRAAEKQPNAADG